MQKRDFIQQAAIRFLDPASPDPDKAIAWAERLWLRLSERGYGGPTPHQPRESRDWYRDLSPHQRQWFDEFWEAFGHKHGRARAAMRWHQLGELDEAEYRRIVSAAKAERRRHEHGTQARKMAEGWLAEARWRDAGPPAGKKPPADDTRRRRREVAAELSHIRELREAGGSEALDADMERLEAVLAELDNRPS